MNTTGNLPRVDVGGGGSKYLAFVMCSAQKLKEIKLVKSETKQSKARLVSAVPLVY